MPGERDAPGVDLYWLPLGAGGHSVKFNGKVYEAIAALMAGRARQALYHSALEVRTTQGRFVIEQAPVLPRADDDRGVVARGPVGARFAGRLPIFRYEIRAWRGGLIPDMAEAVDSPRRLSREAKVAERMLAAVPGVPTPVWGRDEFGTGEMWNSNSVIAWVLERGGVDASSVSPPHGGRAPGWQAGIAVAHRNGGLEQVTQSVQRRLA